MMLEPFPTSYTKNNSKGIHNLNLRPKTRKLLEDNTGQKLYNIGFGNDLLEDAKGTGKKRKHRQTRLPKNF